VIAWLFLLLATVYSNKLQKPSPPVGLMLCFNDELLILFSKVVVVQHANTVVQGNEMPQVIAQTSPQAHFIVAPPYKTSQSDRLLEQGQSELPPTYDIAVQMPAASTSGSQAEQPSGALPLVANVSDNRFPFNKRT
jgi:hypothetical protein